MENVMLNVRALAAMNGMSIEALAAKCGINPNHLKQVSAGNVKMTAEDLQKLASYTGISADNIKTN